MALSSYHDMTGTDIAGTGTGTINDQKRVLDIARNRTDNMTRKRTDYMARDRTADVMARNRTDMAKNRTDDLTRNIGPMTWPGI